MPVTKRRLLVSVGSFALANSPITPEATTHSATTKKSTRIAVSGTRRLSVADAALLNWLAFHRLPEGAASLTLGMGQRPGMSPKVSDRTTCLRDLRHR
jgi:hypothetical protein